MRRFHHGGRPKPQPRVATSPLPGAATPMARPAGPHDRAALAASVDGRLCFAGEATSEGYFTTALAHATSEPGPHRKVLAATECPT